MPQTTDVKCTWFAKVSLTLVQTRLNKVMISLYPKSIKMPRLPVVSSYLACLLDFLSRDHGVHTETAFFASFMPSRVTLCTACQRDGQSQAGEV